MRLVRNWLAKNWEHRLPNLCAKQACNLFRVSRLKGHRAQRQECLCSKAAFALAEVMLGVLIFSIGIIALGRTVSNCVNASALSADDARVREILANRMIEIETTPGQPDKSKEFKIDTGFGIVKLVQTAVPQEMKEEDGTELTGIIRVTLTANWSRGGAEQSKQMAFYVYRL
jgi:Tfp pilus assembly protein PilV